MNTKQKPLIVIHSNNHPNNTGGIESVVTQLISLANSLDVKTKCLFGHHKNLKDYQSDTDTYLIGKKIMWKLAGASFLSFGNASFIKQACRAKLVIFQEPYPTLWPAILVLRKVLRIPTIVLIHANPAAAPRVMSLYDYLRSLVFHGAICVTTSPNLLQNITTSTFAKQIVIPLGIASRVVECTSNSFTLPPNFALYVGRLAAYKGLEYLLEAAVASPEVTYVIAGSGRLSSVVRKKIDSCAIRNVIFINRYLTESEKLELICRSLFLIFPSTTENEAFGLVQLEAMRAGKAIINTNLSSGVNFVAPKDVCALTVEKCSGAAIADASRKLWNSPTLRDSLGKRGQERFQKLFSEDHFLKAWLNLIKSVCIV
ncbi:MAG: glycosyltransferase [Solimonas sp.]